MINKIYCGRPRALRNAGYVTIATFATIVNPALVTTVTARISNTQPVNALCALHNAC